MCGIIGYTGKGEREAAPILLSGLSRLEYRGYDSAGLAIALGAGRGLVTRKLTGRVGALREFCDRLPAHGSTGIAHTRWATHGAPTTRNAHPHSDCHDRIAVVHNGIVENAEALRAALTQSGHSFTSETDTEVLAHLIEEAGGGNPEEGETITSTLRGRLLSDGNVARLNGLNLSPSECADLRRITIVACGTSWHSGLVGRQIIEDLAGIPVSVEYASEYRYRKPVRHADDGTGTTLTIAISQSGETADTLEAMRAARTTGSRVVGIVNVVGSTIAREADGGIYLHAGPEIGVASTKA